MTKVPSLGYEKIIVALKRSTLSHILKQARLTAEALNELL